MAAEAPEIVELRDGSRASVRPLRPGDRTALLATFARLSPESRYRRFLMPMPRLPERTLRHLLDVDGEDREALIAEDADTGAPLAVARYARWVEDPEAAEVAVAVVDDAQGRGLGSMLMQRLVQRARRHGIVRFTALVFADNRAMLSLMSELGPTTAHSAGNGTFELAAELPAGEDIGAGLRGWLRTAAKDALEFRLEP